MARRVDCPLSEFPDAWIDLPDQWLGEHAQRRDEAMSNSPEGTGITLMSFAVALALLENWNLPGLSGNPEKWDVSQLRLPLIGWVNQIVLGEFNACFEIPKVSASP